MMVALRRLLHSAGSANSQLRLDRWQVLLGRASSARPANVSAVLQGRDERLYVGTALDLASALLPAERVAELIVARVRFEDSDEAVLWDLGRPLVRNCSVELLDFGDPDGQRVLWHSTAHILGLALEHVYGDRAQLCDGPALSPEGGNAGFFYELQLQPSIEDDAATVTEASLPALRRAMLNATKRKTKFERLDLTRRDASALFAENPFKQRILDAIPENEAVTAYRVGSFVDLCRGPHVPHMGLVRHGAIELLRCSASHWTPPGVDAAEPVLLQRVYGVSFPDKRALNEWKERREEAAQRDHRLVGQKQGLWTFHPLSPGSAFMLPPGTAIFNRLQGMLREEYHKRGFQEVMTPQLYDSQLWQTSGHLDSYAENMYMVGDSVQNDSIAPQTVGLKPMNCPGHCLLFAHKRRSYRDLPLRIADFSSLHRNEVSGSLGGMTRLRRFHQDDAHIFCSEDQIAAEIADSLNFIDMVYRQLFAFEPKYRLSTKPQVGAIGSDSAWAGAEGALREALGCFAGTEGFRVDIGEGAFYGPKIDVAVRDALGREHQCATIQLDFNLPERFGLEYDLSSNAEAEIANDGTSSAKGRPVMIHRAVLGSLERFIAILAEHTAGKWPFWLSPRQLAVCSVRPEHDSYAHEIADRVQRACRVLGPESIAVEILSANGGHSLAKRIRMAQQAPFSLIGVVGEAEASSKTVNLRSNDGVSIPKVEYDVQMLVEACRAAAISRENSVVPSALVR